MTIHANPLYSHTGYDVVSYFWPAYIDVRITTDNAASDGIASNFCGAAFCLSTLGELLAALCRHNSCISRERFDPKSPNFTRTLMPVGSRITGRVYNYTGDDVTTCFRSEAANVRKRSKMALPTASTEESPNLTTYIHTDVLNSHTGYAVTG